MPCKVNTVKAPNGKRSNLFKTLEKDFGQETALKTWVATKTEIFQNEFGNTQIIDENKEPLIMYRGEKSGIEKYKKKSVDRAEKMGGGFFFTSDRSYAESKGDITPVFLNSENIQIYESEESFLEDVKKFTNTDKPTINHRKQFVKSLHKQGIDVALKGFSHVSLHSDTQYRVAIDTQSEEDIMHPIREESNKKRNKDLENRLISFLAPFGITVEKMDSIKTNLELDAAGAADLTNKLILISQGKADLNTLPEEAGHFIYEMLGKSNPLVQRMRDLALKSPEHQEVIDQYGEQYEQNQEKLLVETVGKLIGKHIVNKFNEEQGQKSIIATVKRIWDRVVNLFKSADVKKLHKEVEEVYGEIARRVLTGETTDLSTENISEGVYFSLDEQEDIEPTGEIETVVKPLLNAQEMINKAKNALEKKIDLIKKTAKADDKKAKNIQKNLEEMLRLLEKENTKAGIAAFLGKAMKDLQAIKLKFTSFEEKENLMGPGRDTVEYTNSEIFRYFKYVEEYSEDFLQTLLDEVKGSPEFDEIIGAELREDYMHKLKSLRTEVNTLYKKLAVHSLKKKLNLLSTNTDLTEDDIGAQLIIAEKDIRSWQRWMEVLAESPDTIVALGAKMINNQKEIGRLETLEFTDELADKIDEFEKFRSKQGVKIGNPKNLYDIFYQKDKAGKLTGRLLGKSEMIRKYGKDSKELEFYEYFVGKYYDMQNKLPAQYNKHLWLPSIRAKTKEQLSTGEKASDTIKEAFKDTFTIQKDDAGFGNLDRTDAKYVPVLYHSNIGTKEGQMHPEDLSYDLGNSLALFGSMAINNAQMNHIVHDLEVLKSILAERQAPKTNRGNFITDKLKKYGSKKERAQKVVGSTKTYEQFEKYMDMVVYGEVTDKSTFNFFGKEVSKVKVADFINRYTSFRVLGLNLFSGTANVTMGKTMNFIEAHGGEWFTKKDYALAEKDYLNASLGFISDVEKKRSHSMGSQLVDLFDALQEYNEYGEPLKENKRWKRLLSTNSAFFIQKGSEHYIQTTLMYAFLRGQKIKDKSGKEISLLEAFEQKDGKLVVKNSVELTKEDIVRYSQKLKQVSQKLHGVYNNQDLLNIQHVWAGRMGIMFRKWLYPSFKRRYGDKRYNERLQKWEEGTYITGFKFIKEAFNQMRNNELKLYQAFKESRAQLSDYQKANLKKNRAELMTSFTIMSLIAMLSALDDDDEERSWIENMTLFTLRRLQSELTMYVNVGEGLKILRSPAASMSTVETIMKLFTGVFDLGRGLIFEGEAPSYKRDTGLYDKGDWKILKPIEELTPFLKEIRAAQAPENRLKFLESD